MIVPNSAASMIVCSCNVLSDSQVRETCARTDRPRSPVEVYRCLGCSPQCGRCARTIRAIIDEATGACPTPGTAGRE